MSTDAARDDKAPIDKQRAGRIVNWIIDQEAENNRSNTLTDARMVDLITKHIQDEVRIEEGNA